MTRAVPLLLGELLEATNLVARYTAELTFEEFVANIEKQDAVVRRWEMVQTELPRLAKQVRVIMASEGYAGDGAL